MTCAAATSANGRRQEEQVQSISLKSERWILAFVKGVSSLWNNEWLLAYQILAIVSATDCMILGHFIFIFWGEHTVETCLVINCTTLSLGQYSSPDIKQWLYTGTTGMSLDMYWLVPVNVIILALFICFYKRCNLIVKIYSFSYYSKNIQLVLFEGGIKGNQTLQ